MSVITIVKALLIKKLPKILFTKVVSNCKFIPGKVLSVFFFFLNHFTIAKNTTLIVLMEELEYVLNITIKCVIVRSYLSLH